MNLQYHIVSLSVETLAVYLRLTDIPFKRGTGAGEGQVAPWAGLLANMNGGGRGKGEGI